MSKPVIRVEDLSKKYVIGHRQREGYQTLRDTLTESVHNVGKRLLHPFLAASRLPIVGVSTTEEFWALRDVSFEVHQGDRLGIIGRNGAGKSTLLKVLSRITEPTGGRISIKGRMASLLEVGTGFHPELTGRENIFLNGAIMGLTQAEIRRKFDEIVAFAEMEKFLDTPVKRYSSGMYMRLAFAVAAHLDAEILLIDEVLAVGDIQFQKKCLGKMEEAGREGRTILFVSHNMQAVNQICQRSVLLTMGQITYDGSTSQAITSYFCGDSDRGAVVDLSSVNRKCASDGARINNIKFLDDEGRLRDRMDRRECLAVAIEFTALRALKSLDVAMALTMGDGTRVFSETLSDYDVVVDDVKAGEYRLEFSLELRYLRTDQYFMTVFLFENQRAIDSVDSIPLPEITDEAADSLKESHRWGVIRIPIRWTSLVAT